MDISGEGAKQKLLHRSSWMKSNDWLGRGGRGRRRGGTKETCKPRVPSQQFFCVNKGKSSLVVGTSSWETLNTGNTRRIADTGGKCVSMQIRRSPQGPKKKRKKKRHNITKTWSRQYFVSPDNMSLNQHLYGTQKLWSIYSWGRKLRLHLYLKLQPNKWRQIIPLLFPIEWLD